MESMSSDNNQTTDNNQAATNATTTTTTNGIGMPSNFMSGGDQLDNLSNLIINSNSWEDDVLDQYENETEKSINENFQLEKEQATQKLFQSFQNSACAVAQMFKDKTLPPQTPWQSFQNSAGAITVLYKDSLEACKTHLDLGVSLGQQRKVKELISWLKKKKRRNIRKDELIAFLIGKQLPQSTSNASIFSFSNTANYLASNSRRLYPSLNQARSQQQQQQRNSSLFVPSQTTTPPPPTTSSSSSAIINNNNNNAASTTVPPNSNPSSNSIATGLNTSNQNLTLPSTTETNYSDLATFREALIMHNRSRVAPSFNHHHHHHINHHHNHRHNNYNANNSSSLASQSNSMSTPNMMPASQQPGPPNCDDLDCFFCEQIATHIEHKRNASSLGSNNFDMESPTRKRGRFY